MRPAIAQTVQCGLHHNGRARKAQHHRRINQNGEHDELHFARFDFLAQIFGCAPHHKTGYEHGNNRNNQKTIEARAHPARPDAAGQQIEHRHQAAQRGQRVKHRIDCPCAGAGCGYGEQCRQCLPEAHLLALHIAQGRIKAQGCQRRNCARFRKIDHTDARHQQDGHGDENRPPLRKIPDNTAKCQHRGHRNEQYRPYLQHIGPDIRVFKRMR